MTKRGFMQGLEFRYITDPESRGLFLGDILSDKEKKDMDNPDDLELSPFSRTNQTRYWFRGRADQNLPLEIKARFDGDFVSDQDYLKEFRGGLFGLEARPDPADAFHRPFEEIFSPTRRSALRLSRDGEAYGLQAITSYYQRPENPPNDDTPQPLAGMDFSVLPRPLPDLPVFLKLDTDYNYIWREEGIKGHSLTFSPALSYPMWLGPYLEFEPTAGFTSATQWLDGEPTDINRQTRNAYEIGGRLSTVLERTFDVAWQDVNRVKHKVFPSLSYTYRGHKDQDRFRPWFEPIDEEGDINRITLSVENFLDVRKKNKKGEVTYNQWGTFSLSQGYDLHEARRDTEPSREKQPFEPLVGILTFMPYHWLDLDAEAHWDHDRNEVSYTDFSLELTVSRTGGRKDSYEVQYQYDKGEEIKSLNYQVSVNLVYGVLVGTSLRRDLELKHTLESSYWIEYKSQCWGVRLTADSLDNVNSIMVSFDLFGIGDI
jgi:LPS-assembly protein